MRIRKLERPRPRRLIAVPETIWLAPRDIETNAWIQATRAPATTPQAKPSHGEPMNQAPNTPVSAAVSIVPSRPILMMPARSLRIPPSVANSSGVASRIVAAK